MSFQNNLKNLAQNNSKLDGTSKCRYIKFMKSCQCRSLTFLTMLFIYKVNSSVPTEFEVLETVER